MIHGLRFPRGMRIVVAGVSLVALCPLLLIPQELQGEGVPEPESGVIYLETGERVVVRGFAWKRGERRDYRIMLDHVPIGRQTYTFVRPVQHAGELLLEYDMFQNLDARALGTPGRRVSTGYLILATDGTPHYYRYEEAFKKNVTYSVNKPVMAGTRYSGVEFFLRDEPPQYRDGKKRKLDGKKKPLPNVEPFVILSDFPFVGQLAIYLQFHIDELRDRGALALSMLDPLKTPTIDYPFDQREFAKVSPDVSHVTLRVDTDEAAKDLDDTVSISIDELGIVATLTTKGKLLTLETGRGLAFHYTEE